ncbi:MAG: nucleoside triphosphate pyrophosphohydrolase [Pseudomonadota bacterium]
MSDARPLPRPASDALVHDETAGLARLREIMRRLREPGDGCPWDLEQTFATIAPYTIEEAHEVADAIAREAMDELEGELGDLLLQVVYHAQMAEEAGLFSFDDVTRAIAEKMLRRHPHVFGDAADRTSAEQVADWERIKAEERAARGATRESALDGVALGLPALSRALKLQNRAARVGFDWPDRGDVIAKVAEEAAELSEAAEAADRDAMEDELGDLLFVIANLARHLDVDPEAALRRTNAKFERRFRAIEAQLAADGKAPESSTLAEMDALWDAVKAAERQDAAASPPAKAGKG